jgi:hypothetical protein
MESRVTSFIAAGRVESGRGSERLGPEVGSASGRTAVTNADEGVAPSTRSASHIGTPATTASGVGVADLTHDVVRSQLTDYLDDSLGDAARRRIDGHLAACRACSADLDSLRLTVRALQQLPAPKAPARAGARIIEQARREQRASGENG